MLIKAALLLFLAAPSYSDCYAQAVKEKRPLVVGVGCCPPAGDWLIVLVRDLEGYKGPCVVVSTPDGGSLYWRATLPPTTGVSEIRAAIPAPVRPAPAAPPMFFQPLRFSGGGGGC